MPELPEVEVTCQGLRHLCHGAVGAPHAVKKNHTCIGFHFVRFHFYGPNRYYQVHEGSYQGHQHSCVFYHRFTLRNIVYLRPASPSGADDEKAPSCVGSREHPKRQFLSL